MSDHLSKSSNYSKAGVNLEAAGEVVQRYKEKVRSTHIPGVLGELGGFGGLFALNEAVPNITDPVLVSGTDGVGTKLKLAFELDKHDTIGMDLVAMCVNDIITVGAKPLFFLDYLATGKLLPSQAEAIVGGIAAGCKLAGCALIGGETAEMPGFYKEKEYDLAGFTVGVVDRAKMLCPENVSIGDKLIAVSSSGFHSNGYSLIRNIIEDQRLDLKSPLPNSERTLGDFLLEPTYIYVSLVADLIRLSMDHRYLRSMAHITGGGIFENLPRALPECLTAQLDLSSWELHDGIRFICQAGNIHIEECYHVFNMGVGLILIVAPEFEQEALQVIKEHHFVGGTVGEVTSKVSEKSVVLSGINE